jgi:hypothetical protein
MQPRRAHKKAPLCGAFLTQLLGQDSNLQPSG